MLTLDVNGDVFFQLGQNQTFKKAALSKGSTGLHQLRWKRFSQLDSQMSCLKYGSNVTI